MKDQSFTLTFIVDGAPADVLAAIQDVRGWWSEGIVGETAAVGDVFAYRHETLHDSTHELIELVPGKSIAWRVTDARLSFAATPDEWKGTELRFDLAERRGRTEVRFTHVGLSRDLECYAMCSKGWSYYVGESLERRLTTGRGKPDERSKAAGLSSAPPRSNRRSS